MVKDFKLGEIASIGSGLVVNRKKVMKGDICIKEYKMLTLKSIDPDGWLIKHELENFESAEILDNKYLTQKGDVIIRLSSPNTAITIDEHNEGYLVPSLFSIIRLTSENVLSEFVGVYLNGNNVKKLYVRSAVGSTIQIIKTSMLRELDIPFEEIKKQRQVVEVNKLIMKEKFLLQNLMDEKKKYFNAIMNKLLG